MAFGTVGLIILVRGKGLHTCIRDVTFLLDGIIGFICCMEIHTYEGMFGNCRANRVDGALCQKFLSSNKLPCFLCGTRNGSHSHFPFSLREGP